MKNDFVRTVTNTNLARTVSVVVLAITEVNGKGRRNKRGIKMEESKIRQIKGALLKCAEENRNKPTPTFNIVVSRLCEDAEVRIRELEQENTVAKTIIQDLLSNSDEYARQRAIDFLKEE